MGSILKPVQYRPVLCFRFPDRKFKNCPAAVPDFFRY